MLAQGPPNVIAKSSEPPKLLYPLKVARGDLREMGPELRPIRRSTHVPRRATVQAFETPMVDVPPSTTSPRRFFPLPDGSLARCHRLHFLCPPPVNFDRAGSALGDESVVVFLHRHPHVLLRCVIPAPAACRSPWSHRYRIPS